MGWVILCIDLTRQKKETVAWENDPVECLRREEKTKTGVETTGLQSQVRHEKSRSGDATGGVLGWKMNRLRWAGQAIAMVWIVSFLGSVVGVSGCRSRSQTPDASSRRGEVVSHPQQVEPNIVATSMVGIRPTSYPTNTPTTRQTRNTKTLQTRYHYIPVGAVWRPEPRIDQWITPYRQQLQARMSQVLAHLKQDFTRNKPESTLGNLVADICLEKLREMGLGVEVFITNIGGIRRNLPAGTVTLDVVFQILPFENELIVVKVSGQKLQQIFAKIAALGGEPIAGATIQFDAQSKRLLLATVGEEPIDPKRAYWLGTNDYLVATGFLQTFLRSESFYVTGITLRDTFQWGLQTKAVPLKPRLDGRVTAVHPQRK